MAETLIDQIAARISPELIQKASEALGESEAGVAKGFQTAIPAVLAKFAAKAESPEGAAELLPTINDVANDGGVLENASGLLGAAAMELPAHGRGQELLGTLFGRQAPETVGKLAEDAGIQAVSMGKLMSVVSPILLALLGKQFAGNATAESLSALTTAQKPGILGALGGLASGLKEKAGDAADKAGDALGAATGAVTGAAGAATDAVKNVAGAAGGAVLGAGAAAAGLASGAAEAVADKAGDALDTAKDLAGAAADKVGDVAGDAVDAVKNLAGGAMDKAGDALGATGDAAKNVAGVVGGAVSGAGAAAAGLASGAAGKAEDAAHKVGDAAGAAAHKVGDAAGKGLDAAEKAVESVTGGLPKWVLPAAGVVLALLVLGYFVRGCGASKTPDAGGGQTAATSADATPEAPEASPDAEATPAPEASPDAMTEVKVGGKTLKAAANGVEGQLVAFLSDPAKQPDKDTWFNFDNLQFETGKATLKPASKAQLQNVAEILKSFPKAAVKIGGYTDNTGNKGANMKLSADRATNVVKQLVVLGIAKDRLASEGYGDAHPAASNDTAEGREQNRRIAVRVTQK